MRKLQFIWLIFIGLPLFAQETQYAKVARVIDGDTVVLTDNVRVRLIGIDTPEIRPAEPFGQEAKALAKKYLKGQMVKLIFDPIKRYDKYGRLLAYVHCLDKDTTDFGLIAISVGYARAYTKFNHSRMAIYLEREKLAKDNGFGLWSVEP